jgi:hypothetical protein
MDATSLADQQWRREDVKRDRKRAERCSAGKGRRPRKELRVPIAGDPASLQDRKRHCDLNERDYGRSCNNGGRRVHHDAKRAMIGVSVNRMRVGYLSDGQQGQQRQAHHCYHKSTRLFAASQLEARLEASKQTPRTLLKDTQIWMQWGHEGHPRSFPSPASQRWPGRLV